MMTRYIVRTANSSLLDALYVDVCLDVLDRQTDAPTFCPWCGKRFEVVEAPDA